MRRASVTRTSATRTPGASTNRPTAPRDPTDTRNALPHYETMA